MTGGQNNIGEDRIRCFVGIAAGDMGLAGVLDERISHWRQSPAMSGVRWTPRDFLHLTLTFMGTQRPDALTALAGLLGGVVARHRAFPIAIATCRGFPDAKSHIVAAIPEASPALLALQREIALAIASLGISLEDRPYLPHITLGRLGRHGLSTVLDEPCAVRGQATAVSLYRSDARPGGSHYSVMARWPLTVS